MRDVCYLAKNTKCVSHFRNFFAGSHTRKSKAKIVRLFYDKFTLVKVGNDHNIDSL